jgi:hypothetical protein
VGTQLSTGTSQYIAALMRGMPVKTDLPAVSYGMQGKQTHTGERAFVSDREG